MLLRNSQIFITALSCPNTPNRINMFQNVTYRPTVYKTGDLMKKITANDAQRNDGKSSLKRARLRRQVDPRGGCWFQKSWSEEAGFDQENNGKWRSGWSA